MWAFIICALPLMVQDSSEHHVRTMNAGVRSLIEIGLSRSETFKYLVAILDESDVIVYIDPKRGREALGGYLAHNLVTGGGYRYLHASVETVGSRRRLVSLLAHELQHAVEVAQDVDARDPEGVERLFSRLAVPGCGSTTCYETQAAKDIEYIVNEELGRSQSVAPSTPG